MFYRSFLFFCSFSFGHCVICPSVFWPLCCLSFCLLAIVLSVLLSFGHCVICPSVFWPLCYLLIYGFWLPLWYLQLFLESSSYEHALWRLFQKPNKFDIYVFIYFINWKWRYIPKAPSTPLFEMELFQTCMSFLRMFIKSEYVLLFNVKYFGKM